MDGKAPLATAHSVRSGVSGFHSSQGEEGGQGHVDDVDVIHPNSAKEEARDHIFLSSSFLFPSSTCPSLQLPFLNCVSSSDHSADHSLPDTTDNGNDTETYDLNDYCFYNSNNSNTTATTTTTTNTLFYTFFLSPSASTASIVSSVWSSGPTSSDADSNETHTTMPGPTYDGPADHVLPPNASDYFHGQAYPLAEQTATRMEPTKHGRSFSRWGRRNHQQSPSNGQAWRVCGRGSLDLPGLKGSPKRSGGHSRSSSIQKRQAQAAAIPEMSREEFEALPLAIQRKYFSTLERLRFAQESGLVDGISQHYDDISNFRRRKPRKDRSLSEQIITRIIRPGSGLGSHSSSSNSSPSYVAPPENTHEEEELTREKQVDLARRLRASVILDAADEAIYNLNRRASRKDLTPAVDTLLSPPSPRRNSMDSHYSFRNHVEQQSGDAPVPQSFYDSFRWLDEDEDLDLRLFLDDYHANLREGLPPNSKQRPSFRRHLSISKLPFGRSSVSSSRPGTNHAATSPTTRVQTPTNSGSSPAVQQHSRRKSRTLSLITSKHAPQQSITAFDPAAAHYQDPEARLKLRVYLASPQKFDEAVEFGFPSADVLSPTAPQGLVDDTPNMGSFLVDGDDDDNASLNSDDSSLGDPDSPKTPEAFENKPGGLRPPQFGAAAPADPNHARDVITNLPEESGYPQAPASSREMTLRMTLTRPDLRAHEDEIYGWQQKQQGSQQHTRKLTIPMVSPAGDSRAADIRDGGAHKDSFEKWVGVDHWNSSTPVEKGVMKRIWSRMRRS
ncbi:hypothetical protein QBC44DRAFT_232502 [Cladorrhinum sp. PSN332]|nr:hypothetical protein QBC44DRAFT_232502 [Cladorrhinum sp. PSN332]